MNEVSTIATAPSPLLSRRLAPIHAVRYRHIACRHQRCAVTLRHIYDRLPTGWFDLKRELEEMPDNTITYEEYQRRAAKHKLEDTQLQRSYAGVLHDLGAVLTYLDDPYLVTTAYSTGNGSSKASTTSSRRSNWRQTGQAASERFARHSG